jgi:predicted PurR-regulated permease PerM
MTNTPAFRELPRMLFAILFIILGIALSLWVLRPFLSALVWAALIVVSTWPLLLLAQRALWGKRSLAVLVMSAALLLIVALPSTLAVLAIASHTEDVTGRLKAVAQAGVPAPPRWVEQLPVVGPKLAGEWQAVAALPPEELQAKAAPHVREAASWLLGKAGGLAGIFLHLLLTVLLSVLLYSSGEAAAAGLYAFAKRLAGERGEESVTLAGHAVRAVALGVLATAFIQTVLTCLGLAVAGVPLVSVLTAIAFVLGVAQVGATPVLLLALAWLYWSGHTMTALLFLPWAIFTATIDNILKPILIKRGGADLPLVLIFAGVIGGLISFGVVGLFVGPVVLAIVYTQLVAWVGDATPADTALAPPAAALPALPVSADHDAGQQVHVQG